MAYITLQFAVVFVVLSIFSFPETGEGLHSNSRRQPSQQQPVFVLSLSEEEEASNGIDSNWDIIMEQQPEHEGKPVATASQKKAAPIPIVINTWRFEGANAKGSFHEQFAYAWIYHECHFVNC
jgi:hypothetical protein